MSVEMLISGAVLFSIGALAETRASVYVVLLGTVLMALSVFAHP
jgi:hypothetical protein